MSARAYQPNPVSTPVDVATIHSVLRLIIGASEYSAAANNPAPMTKSVDFRPTWSRARWEDAVKNDEPMANSELRARRFGTFWDGAITVGAMATFATGGGAGFGTDTAMGALARATSSGGMTAAQSIIGSTKDSPHAHMDGWRIDIPRQTYLSGLRDAPCRAIWCHLRAARCWLSTFAGHLVGRLERNRHHCAVALIHFTVMFFAHVSIQEQAH